MEKHVTSLELSKKLKELGVPQESNFWWVEYTDGFGKEEIWSVEKNHIGYKQFVSAYLASELGLMFLKLGHITTANWRSKGYDFAIGAWRVSFRQNYGHGSRGWKDIKQFAETEVDARAKMLIYLIENSLLKLEDLV